MRMFARAYFCRHSLSTFPLELSETALCGRPAGSIDAPPSIEMTNESGLSDYPGHFFNQGRALGLCLNGDNNFLSEMVYTLTSFPFAEFLKGKTKSLSRSSI